MTRFAPRFGNYPGDMNSIFGPPIPTPAQIAQHKLEEILGGSDAYWEWYITLPAAVRLNMDAYDQAIFNKLNELTCDHNYITDTTGSIFTVMGEYADNLHDWLICTKCGHRK